MTKQNREKDTKKLMRKNRLAKTIQQKGINDILYPRGIGDKHCYTQEVMILAEQQGLTQLETANILGVKQPMISQWLNGEPVGLASVDMLKPLIALLTPKLPGDKFKKINYISSITKSIPSDWEEKMIMNHFSTSIQQEYYKKYKKTLDREQHQFTREYLNAAAITKIQNEYNNQKQELEKKCNQEVDVVKGKKNYFEELINNCEMERASNLEAIEINSKARQSFSDEMSGDTSLTEAMVKILLNKSYPVPIAQETDCEALLIEGQQLKKEFNLDEKASNNDILFALESKIKTIESKQANDLQEINAQSERQIHECKIFDLFDPEYVQEIFSIPSLVDTSPKELSEIAQKLYGNKTRTVSITLNANIGYGQRETFNCDVVFNFKDIYIDYVNSVRGEIKYETEKGHLCYSSSFESNNLEKGNNVENLIHTNSLDNFHEDVKYMSFNIYQLYSDDLLLVVSVNRVLLEKDTYYNEFNEVESTPLTFIYRCKTANNCIDKMECLLESYKFVPDKYIGTIEEATMYLLSSGYRLNTVKPIY